MVFIHDTEMSLRAAAALVNTLPETDSDGVDRLRSQTELDAYLAAFSYTGSVRRDAAELVAVRANRPRLWDLWRVNRDDAVPLVNAMLRDGQALPQLVIHGEFDWHIHATDPDAPLAMRMLVESAMAFVDVIRSDQWERVRVCSADDCASVYVDFSKNGSKRYCDTGNCGNRMNVNAYRQRKARQSA
ncbi:CGNR zinc finger domain-containing protein [Microbacterium sp. VKM Ac-2870]|uniref:CGNR zinc finger domain-containing protein n=1 Tax=Microbacterium sp. VKM Ac-2870 TaxID=2783825 RepID=UPI00188BE928|nr:CGNR zinc finger domain-containing protein [Microbacterium sp. VKM Ac-2870]MBF4561015.1 CGNR zinc finger domain-containing protein [Microbacterium sp. VKM Ac-2870]